MKKTLMVLTFALCATFVFAQTSLTLNQSEFKAPAKAAQLTQNTVSSIFTKDATPLLTVDFDNENVGYSTGYVTGGTEEHGENYDFAVWKWWPDVSTQTFTQMGATYSALLQNYFGGESNFNTYLLSYFDTATSSAENGFMMMSTYDQRTRYSGNFNAYILFTGIDASNADVVDVRFYQYYRKYYDYCYIDYNTGSAWNEVQINVRGVDVAVNGALRGFVTYYLPVAAAGSSNLSIRIRYKSLDSDRNAYGYFWMVDDVSVIPGEADRLQQYDQEYVEGNYGLIPQNMQINPAWYTHVYNNGANAQAGVESKLFHMDAAQSTTTEVVSYNNGNVAVSADKDIVADRHGWLLVDSLEYRGWYGYADHNGHGTGIDLPTGTAGDNYMFATVGNSTVSLSYDTMYYNVTTANNGVYRWGHDNGVLVYLPTNYWLYGYVQSDGNWYVTDDPEEVHFYDAGYTVTSRFTTDANVPAGWVIRGVEMVASPVNGYHSTGSKISAALLWDDYDGDNVTFRNIVTGANIKEITAADINDSNVIGRNSNGYRELGNYNTIVIDFPEQPALEPYTTYRVGYSMEEESYFALAHEAYGSYRMASPTRPDEYDTIIYFRNNEATAKYANTHAHNSYQTYVIDPSYGGSDGRTGMFGYYVDYNPMIRLLVGPSYEVTRRNITIECDSTDYGEVYYGGEEACGTTIHPVEGSTATVVASAAAGCYAQQVIVDGVAVEPWDEDTETGDPHLTVNYDEEAETYSYQYRFERIQADHNIRFVFAERVSIDPVASSVRLSLNPNPATAQVNINIAGVSGMVNCSLIDMSGRVVYNQNINAESNHIINLNSLAKGAYFVRITNDKFSKVEKLIVR